MTTSKNYVQNFSNNCHLINGWFFFIELSINETLGILESFLHIIITFCRFWIRRKDAKNFSSLSILTFLTSVYITFQIYFSMMDWYLEWLWAIPYRRQGWQYSTLQNVKGYFLHRYTLYLQVSWLWPVKLSKDLQ